MAAPSCVMRPIEGCTEGRTLGVEEMRDGDRQDVVTVRKLRGAWIAPVIPGAGSPHMACRP